MRVAIIPARGGSKRIPRKNIRPFCGKPMIAWSIQAALQSDCFERVIVSTDDKEIAQVAKQQGAEVPFMRPASLADDYTGTQAVIAQAINALGLSDSDLVCCVYATAPFVTVADLQQGLQLLRENDANYAFSVTSYAFPVQRAIRLTAQSRVEMFQPEHFNTRSQDLEEAWHDAGQFYWGKVAAWRDSQPIFTNAAVPVALPRHRVQDIDTPEDWQRAEWLFQAWKKMEAGK